ncbi:hypothetical protein Bhyg_00679 [Pseudolycoriella hygida]|uniref:Uncharacterized protein n=1 Tax=Pseudolycoriella hygida TaxID=35572 RepID=A0A9Q0S644_9DIPT|nr:hypothetical protein Bhyg_00679 [Pseudolycoriella hygida]
MHRIIVLIALFGLLFDSVQAHAYELNFLNLTYGAESSDIEINATISQNGMMTLNSFLYKPIADYYMQVTISFDDGTGNYGNTFINKTIDICKFFSTPTYEPIIQLYYKALMKHENNFPTICPIVGPAYYYLRNVEISSMPVPPIVPGNNAYVHINYLMKENQQFKSLASGKVFINFRKL